MDTASTIMFSLIPVLAILFSVFSIAYIHVKDLYDFIIGFFTSLVATICWGIFAYIWPVVATEAMYRPITYLWSGFAAIFFVFVFIYIILYISVATDPHRRQEAALTLK
jgi:hypothetical protein